ncbi:MAG: tRNA pseudouridine(55) synthase TruB [Woeseiaceae bacterium]|nr:tRNA pseudouridine(55) synthase TruB [Woeseiaceae bacterium]
MARYETVDGILLLNKPAGLTSNQALQRVKRLFRAKKAGHTGSLDPAATGMLPLCFGEATKVCAFLLDADKSYRVTARLGSRTDTGDATGAEIDTAAVPELDAEQWRDILDGFLGDSLQVPPMYSALKKGGKRLYEMARKGETVEREPRPIRIYAIDLMESRGKRLVFRVHCSKGTYVRSLVEDIAAKAGTVAHTASLHRETVGEFDAADMLDMGSLEADAEAGKDVLHDHLLPPDAALGAFPALELNAANAAKFTAGQEISMSAQGPVGFVRVYGEARQFCGVGELTEAGALAPKRVFHSAEKNS